MTLSVKYQRSNIKYMKNFHMPVVGQKITCASGWILTLRKILGWINQILVSSTIEYGYYTDNQNFGWAKTIFSLIKFG